MDKKNKRTNTFFYLNIFPLTNDLLASQMAEDHHSVINVACQERREAWSATRSLQRTTSSVMLINESNEYDVCNNDARKEGIDNMHRTIDILKKLIFVVMTVLSLSILVTQGSVCISK